MGSIINDPNIGMVVKLWEALAWPQNGSSCHFLAKKMANKEDDQQSIIAACLEELYTLIAANKVGLLRNRRVWCYSHYSNLAELLIYSYSRDVTHQIQQQLNVGKNSRLLYGSTQGSPGPGLPKLIPPPMSKTTISGQTRVWCGHGLGVWRASAVCPLVWPV